MYVQGGYPLRFTRKMQRIIFGFSLIPAVALMILGLWVSGSRIEPFVRQNLAHDADFFATHIETCMNDRFVPLTRIRDHQDTRRMLSSPPDASEETNAAVSACVTDMFALHMEQHAEVQALYLEDSKRNIVACKDPLYPERTSLIPFSDIRRLAAEPGAASRIIISFPAADEDPCLILGLPIFGQQGYEGCLISVLGLGFLHELIDEEGMFGSTFRLVYDENSMIVAMSGTNGVRSLEDLAESTDLPEILSKTDLAKTPGGIVSYRVDGKRSVGAYRHIPSLGWTVFTGTAARAFQPMTEMIMLSICISLMFLIALAIALNHTVKSISSPIQALIDGMEHVTSHDYRYHIEVDDRCEYNDIIVAFNSLMDHVDKDTNELKRLSRELDTLTTNIPGGVFKCSLEPGMPFLFTSEPFVELIGCKSADDVRSQSGNRFLHIIHPDDRAFVEKVIGEIPPGLSHGSVEFRTIFLEHRWISCSFRIPDFADGEAAMLFGLAVDATETHEAFDKLRTSDERHRIMLDQTDEVLFEWDVKESRFLFTSREKNWVRMFGKPFTIDADFMAGDMFSMHPDDRMRFSAAVREMVATSQRQLRIEVRLSRFTQGNTEYFWTRFILTSMLGSTGRVERIAGRIQDIHDEKIEALRLIGLSQTDPLTSLLNRRGFQSSVSRVLDLADPQQNHHALLMIDADDFKIVNDTHGHIAGDEVLAGIAHHIKDTFRATDVFGRLGGDEFAIFLVNFPDRQLLAKKIMELLIRLRHDGVFCSVGVALYPEDGLAFNDLYRSADTALYFVKNNGKRGYAFTDSDRVQVT